MKAIDFFFKSVKEQLDKEHLDESDYFAILHLVRFVGKVEFGFELQDGEFYLME